MAQAALRPSKNLGRLLRERRKANGWTLREVSERIAARGEPFPTSTLAHVEQGKLDPGARRLHLLLRLYSIPGDLVTDLIELETLAVEIPLDKSLDEVYADGEACWSAGETLRGLAHMVALRSIEVTDKETRLTRQKATIAFANYARSLGRPELAKRAIDELLMQGVEPELTWRALALASSIWSHLGSLEAALAFIRQASTHLRPDARKSFSIVMHQEARLLLDLGDPKAALERTEHALRHYRALEDGWGETACRLLQVRVYMQMDRYAEAVELARAVIAAAEKHQFARLIASGQLQLGRALTESGKAIDALDPLRAGWAKAIELEDDGLQFDAHYRLWKTYESLGEPTKAQRELEQARIYADFTDENGGEVAEVRAATRKERNERKPKRRPRRSPDLAP